MSMVTSNLALVQCQGIVVGFVASIVAVIMDFMKGGELDLDHTLLLCASAIVTASIASFLLGLVMVGVIVLSRRCKVNWLWSFLNFLHGNLVLAFLLVVIK